jgi:hypothetical protein
MYLVIVTVLIVIDDGFCLAFIGLEPLFNNIGLIICPPDESLSFYVADAPLLRGLEQNVVDAAALWALAACRNPLDQDRYGNGEMDNGGMPETARLEITV